MKFVSIIIILSGLFGLIYGFKITNKFARVINWVMVAAIAISFVPSIPIKIDGYYLFALTHLLVIVYAFSQEDFTQQKKLFLTAIAVLSVAPVLCFLGSLSPQALLIAELFSVIGVGIYIFLLLKDVQSYKEEIGFLTMLVANCLTWAITGVLWGLGLF